MRRFPVALLLVTLCHTDAQRVSEVPQGLKNFAADLRDGTDLYTFDLKAANTDLTLLLQETIIDETWSTSDMGDCFSSGNDAAACQYVQGLIMVIITAGFITIMTILCSIGFCCGRGCARCKCCCNNCLGKEPNPQGYPLWQTFVLFGVAGVLVFFIVLFAALGLDAAMGITDDLDAWRDRTIAFTQAFVPVIDDLRPNINAVATEVATDVDTYQASLTTARSNVANKKAQLVTDLNELANLFNSFSFGASSTKTSAYNTAISNAATGANNLKVPSVTFEFTGQEVIDKTNNDMNDNFKNFDDVKTDLVKQEQDITDAREDMKGAENGLKSAFAAIYSVALVAAVFVGLAVALNIGPLYWASFSCTSISAALIWFLFGIVYMISHIMSDTCDLLPYKGSTNGEIFPKYFFHDQADLQPKVRKFVDTCVVTDTGNLLDVFGFNASSLTNSLNDFNLAKQFNTTDVSDWDFSVLNQVDTSTDGIAAETGTSLLGAAYTSRSAADQQTLDSELQNIQTKSAAVRTLKK